MPELKIYCNCVFGSHLCSCLVNNPHFHLLYSGFMLFAGLFYARVMRIPLCKLFQCNLTSSNINFVCNLTRFRAVLSYHTHLPLYGRNYLGFIPYIEEMAWAALRYCHSRADLTLVTSPQMKEEMEANGIPRVEVWRKGIDTIKFQPKFKSESMRRRMLGLNNSEEDQKDNGELLMVYVGRLGAEKRLKDIKPMLEQLPNARLCIVGTGPQEEELKEYFEGTNTVFTGQLTGDDLSAAFASADVFLMPSDSETLGFVVLESMASGVPVVGCKAGGIPDLIRHEDTGFLVEVGDIDGYLSCIRKLSDEKYRAEMGKRARAEAELWGWEAATSVLRNVQYEKAMINFHSRAFGGFSQNKVSLWRRMRTKVARALGRVGIPGFRRYYRNSIGEFAGYGELSTE